MPSAIIGNQSSQRKSANDQVQLCGEESHAISIFTFVNLSHAIQIATEAYKSQKDKEGEPCITHVLRVMQRCKTDEEKIVSVLHDVVEDTEWKIQDLRKEMFNDKILAAVEAITRNEGESKRNYIKRVKKNPLATRVKLNDLEDNMNFRRFPKFKKKDFKRLRKYSGIYRDLLKHVSV